MSVGDASCIAALTQKNGDSMNQEIAFNDALESLTPLRLKEDVS